LYGKQSLFTVLCTSPTSHLPHIHQLIYQADDHSDADMNDPPTPPNNESVAGLKQPPESLIQVTGQPDNHDSIEELVDGAYNLLVSNEFFLILLYTL